MIPPELLKKILDAIASGDEKAQAALLPDIVAAIAGGGMPAEEPAAAEALAEGGEPKPPAPGEQPVAASVLAKALGCKTDAEAAETVKGMQARLSKLDADAATVELNARVELVADLVKLGVEFPATAWEGKPEDRKPTARLMSEPIAELRTRVELHKASTKTGGHRPPPSGDDKSTEIKLSKAEQDYCTKNGLSKEQFQARKAGTVRSAK